MTKGEEVENGQNKRNLILSRAFALIMEKGYAKTSYTDIAKACGLTRPLVQYYFPKKEMFMREFIERLLELCGSYLHQRKLNTGSCFTDFYLTGFMYFTFLLENEELIPLAKDLIATRSATESISSVMTQWVASQDELRSYEYRAVETAVITTMGGVYDLIFHRLSEGGPDDIPSLLAWAIKGTMVQLGMDAESLAESFKENALPEATAKAANEYLLEEMANLP